MNAGTEGPSTPPDGARSTEEQCPICGASLREDQDWCLRCGTAARTRLAPVPRWRLLVAVVAIVTVLSLAGLTAAVVKLAGGSSSSGSANGAAATPPASALSTPGPILTTTTAAAALPATTGVVATSASSPITTVRLTSVTASTARLTTAATHLLAPRLTTTVRTR